MRRLLLIACVPILLALSPAPASAGVFAPWVGLPGLNAANGASWVREYVTGLPPTTLYAATEADGVYKSVTGGVSWTRFSSGLDGVPGATAVRTVYTSGTDAYAGTSAGLFKSTGGAGAWTPVAQGPEVDPKNPKKLNAAVQAVLSPVVGQMLAGVASGGVYKSSDGGATWTPPAPGNGMSRSETVWSLAQLVPGSVFAATSSGIYRSLDGGSTWTLANDGISGTTLRVMADSTRPNLYYAATPGNGIFRTINGGITWSAVNGSGTHALNTLGMRVRAMQQVGGVNETRLYAGTEDGLWVGTSGTGLLPGPMRWRHIDNQGLVEPGHNNTNFWGLYRSVTTLGTILAGTQSNGGYALVMTPPVNTAAPAITGTKAVGSILSATTGNWDGTPTIEFEYQWLRCVSAASCTEIPDATNSTYPLVAADQGKFMRVVVTASNDFPSFPPAPYEKESALTTVIGANMDPTKVPGYDQSQTASIEVQPASSFPTSGNTLHAKSWLFNPAATSTKFQWLRCDTNGSNCHPLPGAVSQDYVLTDEDVTLRLCVKVIGTNGFGTTTLGCSATTNEIFPQQATQTAPATMEGKAYVGESLVSTVGAWKYPGTTYTRQWENCSADGSGCSTISGQNGASYVVRAADLGDRLRVRITADSNASNKVPAAVEVFTPLSDIVTPVPVVVADPPGGGGGGGGGGAGGGGGGGGAPADVTPPGLQTLSFASAKVKSGGALQLRYKLSEPGSLSVEVQRLLPGKKVGKKCKAGAKKGKKCTVTKSLGTIRFSGLSGSGAASLSTKLRGKKLAAGSYRAVVTPIDGAGNKGAARAVNFTVKR